MYKNYRSRKGLEIKRKYTIIFKKFGSKKEFRKWDIKKRKKEKFWKQGGITVGREFYWKNKIMKNMEAKRDLGKKVWGKNKFINNYTVVEERDLERESRRNVVIKKLI